MVRKDLWVLRKLEQTDSERPNHLKLSSAEPRSFGHSHRSFGRSFGRIFAQKLGEIFGKMQQKIVGLSRTSLFCYNQKILIEKKTQFQLVIRCHNITLMWYSNNEFVKFEKLREIRPKWRNFIDSVVRYAWPKLRPNYFGRNWPKLRPKLRFRSYTIFHILCLKRTLYFSAAVQILGWDNFVWSTAFATP